jgi:hypothetical protein
MSALHRQQGDGRARLDMVVPMMSVSSLRAPSNCLLQPCSQIGLEAHNIDADPNGPPDPKLIKFFTTSLSSGFIHLKTADPDGTECEIEMIAIKERRSASQALRNHQNFGRFIA